MAIITAAVAGVWTPVWQGPIDAVGLPQVDLIGVDQTGESAWLRVGDGARSTIGMWQVDLSDGHVDGQWTAGNTPSAAHGALSPLVHSDDLLQRWSIVQAHVAGRATWPLVSFGSEGPWLAWEHGTEAGGDGVTVSGPSGTRTLGDEDLVAVYRPRFHPTEPLVVYAGATARGTYRVVVEHLVTGETRTIDGVAHASHLDWDARGALWVTGGGCVSVVRDLITADPDPVVCGSEELRARLSPDGTSVAVADWSGEGAGAVLAIGWFSTRGVLLGNARVGGGLRIQAFRDDGVLVVSTRDGSAVVDLGGERMATLEGRLQGGLHDHWVDGRTLMLTWSASKRKAGVGWLDPDEVWPE